MGKCFRLHGYRDLRRRSCHLGNRNDPPLVKHLQKERVDWRSLKVGLLCLQSLCKEILKGKLIFVEYLIYFIISEIGNIVTTYRDTLTPPVKASLVSMYLKKQWNNRSNGNNKTPFKFPSFKRSNSPPKMMAKKGVLSTVICVAFVVVCTIIYMWFYETISQAGLN